MFRFISLFILFLFLYYFLSFVIRHILFPRKRTKRESEPEELVQDPYCHTYIPKGSAVKKRIAGEDHYFCNTECLRRFIEKDTAASS